MNDSDAELSPQEGPTTGALEQSFQRPSSPPTLHLKQNEDGDVIGLEARNRGPNEDDDVLSRLATTLSTESDARAQELVYRLLDLTSFMDSTARRETVINRILAMLHERDVESPTEAMQCIQMLVADQLQHQMARKAMAAEHMEQTEFYLTWCEKFQNQTNQKIESLQDIKDEPEQRIRVERVEVDDGGQAVLGNFQAEDEGGGG